MLTAAFFISCSTSKKTSSNAGDDQKTSSTSNKGTEDGLSFETAVVINETSEGPGVAAEYKWIKKNYSNYTIKGQSLTFNNKKSYDIITIELSDGKEQKLYFDITKFFGKF
jgi:hypothetical protein